MERKILFKAKRLSDGKWVKGSLVNNPIGPVIVWWEDSIENIVDVDPSTVCQFTGLKDKNGVEVWEHDIIQDPHQMVRCEVRWNEFICWLAPYGIANSLGGLIKNQGWTVVGNKFDRKEGEV